MAAKRFRTRPVEIEAVQFQASIASYAEVMEFTKKNFRYRVEPGPVQHTNALLDDAIIYGPSVTVFEVYDILHDTWIKVGFNDWIIRGTKGEYYACVDETFRWKYEELGEKIHKVKVSANRPGPVDNTAFYDSYYKEGHQ